MHTLTSASVWLSGGTLDRLLLALTWLTVAMGAVVFAEPAPADLLMLVLIVLLPLAGLVRVEPALGGLLGMMLVAGAAALLGATRAFEIELALAHTGISLYLYLATIVMAGFIAKRPGAHASLVLNAYLCAAMVAALAGSIGYFELIPGAREMMTRYGRATGLFKDPNVFGPFLLPAMLYVMSRLIEGQVRRAVLWWATLPILGIAILLSFSRGAWLCAGVSLLLFGGLQFLTASTARMRRKLLGLVGMVTLGGSALVFGSLQLDGVADLFAERAALTQDYDEGPDGRFGGQQKAADLVLQHALGIGAQQFAPYFHHEEPHNTYLALLLNAGWLGGAMFLAIIATTLWHGLRRAVRYPPQQPIFLAAYAAFAGHAVEAAVIDIDHWRHFYLLLAVVWGLLAGARPPHRPAA
jgi:O-antigen ligase